MSDVFNQTLKEDAKINLLVFSCYIQSQLSQFVDSAGRYETEDGVEFVVLTEAKFLSVYGCDLCSHGCREVIDENTIARADRIRLSTKLTAVFPENDTVVVKKKSGPTIDREPLDMETADGIVSRWQDFLLDLHQTGSCFVDGYHNSRFFYNMETVFANSITIIDTVYRCLNDPPPSPQLDTKLGFPTDKWIPIHFFLWRNATLLHESVLQKFRESSHEPTQPFEDPVEVGNVARMRWIPELMPVVAHEMIRCAFSLMDKLPIARPVWGLLNFDPKLFFSSKSAYVREFSNTVVVVQNSHRSTMPQLRADTPVDGLNRRALCANVARVFALLYTKEFLSPTFEYTGTPQGMKSRLSVFGDALLPEFYELVCKLARGTISSEAEAHVLIDCAFSHQVRGLSFWKMYSHGIGAQISPLEVADVLCAYEGADDGSRSWRNRILPALGAWQGSMIVAIEPRLLRYKREGEDNQTCLRRVPPSLPIFQTNLQAWDRLYYDVLSHRQFPHNQPDIRFAGEIQLGLTPIRDFLCSVLQEYMSTASIDPIFKYHEHLGVVELCRDLRDRNSNSAGLDNAILHAVTFFLTTSATPPFVFGPAVLYAAAGLHYDATAIASATFLLDQRWHGMIDIDTAEESPMERSTYTEGIFANHRVLYERVVARRWRLTNEVERRMPRLRIPDFLSVLCNGITFSEYAFFNRTELSIDDVRGCLILAIAKNANRFLALGTEFVGHLYENYGPEHFEFSTTDAERSVIFYQLFFDVEQGQNQICERTRQLHQSFAKEAFNLTTMDYLIRFILSSDLQTSCQLYKTMTDEERPPAALIYKTRMCEIKQWMAEYPLGADVRDVEYATDTINFDPRIQLAVAQLANYGGGSTFDIAIDFLTTQNWQPQHVTVPSVLTCSRELSLRENSCYANFCAGMQTFISQCNSFSMV